MRFDILMTPDAVAAISDEWNALHKKYGRGIFGGYAWHEIWWAHLGSSSGVALHVITARIDTGELVGILPLSTRRSFGLRVAGWAGGEAFDYGDVLAVDGDVAAALWLFARKHGRYDIALLQDVHQNALSAPVLARDMNLRRHKKNYFLSLDFPSGDVWLAAQSRKLRGDTRRKTEKLQDKGAVGFNVYRDGDIIPVSVIDALYTQKREWFAARKARGVFARVEVKGFLLDLAQDAARRGMLYLAWLSCGDAIAACHMGFVQGGILYLYHTTYDPAYGVFSPGNILMIETIQKAVDSGWRELDFMRGEETYKARFASGQRLLSTYAGGRSWAGKLAVALQSNKNVSVVKATEPDDSPA